MIQKLAQAIDDKIHDVLGGVHTAMPGVVMAVYPESGMIDAQPVGSYFCSGIEMEYPVVPGVPLCITANQEGTGFCYPVKEGDSVLLILLLLGQIHGL